MPLYAVVGLDNEPASRELRECHRAEHRAYVLEQDAQIRLAGAMVDNSGRQCGTLMIFEAQSADEIWEWCRKEPFFSHEVYQSYQIIEWRLARNCLEHRDWPVNPG